MFLVNHIWGRAARQSLWAILFAVLLCLVPQAVSAAGESYTWQGTGDASIVASGGNFGVNKTTFAKTADAGGSATFTANATYECSGKTVTGPLTITVAADKYKKAYPTEGSVTGAGAACAFTAAVISKANVDQVTGQPVPAAGQDPRESCDQGGFTWLFCPVIDNISSAVAGLARDVLGPMLEVKPISPETTPDLYKTWTHIRDFAVVLFILVFFAIIGATLIQQDIGGFDQYTVKKILPRLVIASIMVQFSFLISGIIVDIGNVLGGGIGHLLSAVTDPSKGPASFTNLVGNLVTGSVASVAGLGAVAVLASWTVAIPVLLGLLLSLLTVFLTLGARFLILAVLIAISPIAMLAWVLPNTRDFAAAWFEFFVRLVLMYPLVILIISVAGIVNQILPFSGDTANSGSAAVAVALIKPLVVIAAFLIIPISFKLAGLALSRIHGLLTGVAQQGKGLIKGSDMYQRGLEDRQGRKNTYMGRVLNSKTISSLQNKGRGGQAVGGFMSGAAAVALMRAPASKAALQRSNSALVAKREKNLTEIKEAQNPNNLKAALAAMNGDESARAKLQRTAPDLLRLASTASGREAMFNRLLATEFADSKDLDQFRTTAPKRGLKYFGVTGDTSAEWRSLRDAGQAKRNQLPTIVQRLEQAKTYDVVDRAGNTLKTISRDMGAVDMNGVSKSFAKYTAAKLADVSPDVFEMMTDTANPIAAMDAAEAMAIGLEPRQLAKVFDPNDRNPAPPERKIAIAKAMRAQYENVWNTNDEYRSTFDAMHHQLVRDDKLGVQLTRTAGATETQLRALSNEGQSYVASRWLKDKNFKYSDLSGMTVADINAAGHALRR